MQDFLGEIGFFTGVFGMGFGKVASLPIGSEKAALGLICFFGLAAGVVTLFSNLK